MSKDSWDYPYQIWNADCLDVAESLVGVDCIFADPPDNIGLGYNGYKDKLHDMEYKRLLSAWLRTFTRYAGVTWISFNSKWLIDFAAIVYDHLNNYPTLEFKPFVQTFTFGQNQKSDCCNCHRPLWRFRWPNAPLYPEQIKVPSWRELNGDKRAAKGGKVPGDVWEFPRVTGNSKQRRSWHPTQLHEGLVERAIKMSTKEGDWVVDPFGGTGTTLRVCKRIKRDCTLVEIDEHYCQKIGEEHELPYTVGG